MSTLYDEKKKVLALIEELNPKSEYLTDDTDIEAKINYAFNQVLFEIVRFKKIPKYIEMEVSFGDIVTLEDLERECGYQIYQVDRICGVAYEAKASGTVYKMCEDGTAEIDVFVYPESITDKTKDKAYEFELSPDALEILSYGVAADLLSNDETSGYGNIYRKEFERKLSRLDPRYRIPGVCVKGGLDI